MSEVKQRLFELMEQDAEWSRHVHEHGLQPSMNCSFCVCNAEEVEVEVGEIGGEI